MPRCKTGKVIWKERLDGNLWGSMLLAGGKLYVTNLEGETFVLAAGPKFQLLARNKIERADLRRPGGRQDGEIFLRTYKHLYCIKQAE